MERPYIICHMMASLDGRIDCAMTEKIEGSDAYYEALDRLQCPSTLSGRVTMEMHFAEPQPYVAVDPTPVGRTATHVARHSEGYSVCVDSHGRLRYPAAEYDGLPLLCIVSRQAPAEYLDLLARQGISWIAAGDDTVDLTEAMTLLRRDFGVERLAVVGGGHLNAAMLDAGLLDGISMMYGPGIDGRRGQTAAFDGLPADREPYRLRLRSVESFACGTVWMRYDLE